MGGFALARPFIALFIVAVSIVPAIIIYNGKLSYNSIAKMSDKYDSVKGYNLIADHFEPGESMPATIVMKNGEKMIRANIWRRLKPLRSVLKKSIMSKQSGARHNRQGRRSKTSLSRIRRKPLMTGSNRQTTPFPKSLPA